MRSDSRALGLHRALALGFAQGPTELLPLSSSAHTTLIALFAGWPYGELDPHTRKTFEVALHAGGALALAIGMRDELIQAAVSLDRRGAAVIALSSAPPALAGLAFEREIERHLSSPRAIAWGLAAGAVAMAIADAGPALRRRADAGARDGLALGLAQALALIPGVSRNGATLAAARALGFERADAQTLSWHAAMPVILGASALRGMRVAREPTPRGLRRTLVTGAAAAFCSTLASARLLDPRRGRPLLPFALYRCLLAAVVLARLRAGTRSDSQPGDR